MEAYLLGILLLLKRNYFYASGCPIRTCRDRRYRRGSSLATPSCSVVRHTPRAVQSCRLGWLPPGLLGPDDWHPEAPGCVRWTAALQGPFCFIPVESLDCGSRGKNKTMSCVCTEQLRCRQTADVGIVHPPKISRSQGRVVTSAESEARGTLWNLPASQGELREVRGKFREAPRYQRCSLWRNTFENLKLLAPKRSNSVIFF